MSERKIAILLAGCGNYDGTDIHEAAACAVAVEKYNLKPVFCSIDKDQTEVIDHLVPAPMNNCSGSSVDTGCRRNIFVESGRIARGQPLLIQELEEESISGLIIPGGIGVLSNLSSIYEFARNTSEVAEVDEGVHAVIKSFHATGKPIGVVSHAALLPGIVLNHQDVEVTLGRGDETEGFNSLASRLGVQTVECENSGVHVDSTNKIVSVPGFICPSKGFMKVHNDICSMVEQMVNLLDLAGDL